MDYKYEYFLKDERLTHNIKELSEGILVKLIL